MEEAPPTDQERYVNILNRAEKVLDRLNWLYRSAVILTLFVAVGVWFVFGRAGDVSSNQTTIIANQDVQVVRSLKARAETCRVEVVLGISLDANCKDLELQPYFDSSEKLETKASVKIDQLLNILCAYFAGQDQRVPACLSP